MGRTGKDHNVNRSHAPSNAPKRGTGDEYKHVYRGASDVTSEMAMRVLGHTQFIRKTIDDEVLFCFRDKSELWKFARWYIRH